MDLASTCQQLLTKSQRNKLPNLFSVSHTFVKIPTALCVRSPILIRRGRLVGRPGLLTVEADTRFAYGATESERGRSARLGAGAYSCSDAEEDTLAVERKYSEPAERDVREGIQQ